MAISNVGEHTINLIISFPDTYPEESPEFRFDSSTTIEESLQVWRRVSMLTETTCYAVNFSCHKEGGYFQTFDDRI